ncbi:glycosyltransferase [Leptolyngbya sp. NIES-2104]|uniref:glycosyltransferase n=1 Tax=Leptolyngbya sp. NIES-2104 TaxID=1552121 RepID=UPI0006EC9EC2|nr:glycosyltransferase [Leptolyngbya sp. NIES-2104]GAP95719.1 dolichol-phosphate mannosyltransferase homolog [Leptolyngbya sp. NIES-2104]
MIVPPSLLLPPSGALRIPYTSEIESSTKPIAFSLVVPTYNEGRNVEQVVRVLSSLLDHALPNDYELIIVDDDSPDRTWEIAQQMTAEFPNLRVMRRQDERGLSTAVIRGWQAARGEILGVIDGDLQHPPEVLLKLVQSVQNGADLAVASRHVEGGGTSDWGLIRRMLSRGAQLIGLVILPSVVGRVSDPMSGYFMVRRSAIADCLMSPLGYKILLEVLGRGRVDRLTEVGYVFQERQEGESKVTWKQYVEYLMHLGKLRSRGRIGRLREKFQLGRFLRFGLVGFSGVFVDMIVLYLLSDPTTLAWNLTRSKIIASELAIVNNFLWNDLWTFGDISRSQRGNRTRFKRFIKFNVICLMGLILNVLILNLLYNAFGINRYVANLIAIVLVTFWNFWINLKLSWRVTDVPRK